MQTAKEIPSTSQGHEHDPQALLAELAHETGIGDPEVLQQLLKFGVGADMVRALELSPLFFVAWADGDMDLGEDQFIHDHIKKLEEPLSGSSYRLMSHWFNIAPVPEYFEAWKLYTESRWTHLDATQRRQNQETMLSAIRKLALASGGFLGIGPKVSRVESKQMKKIERTFVRLGQGR